MISLLSGVLVAYSLVATNPPKCEKLSYEEITKVGRQAVADNSSLEFSDFSGPNEKKLLSAINAEPPETKLVADHILVMEAPESPVIVALSNKGCVTGMFKMPNSDWIRIRKTAIGDAS